MCTAVNGAPVDVPPLEVPVTDLESSSTVESSGKEVVSTSLPSEAKAILSRIPVSKTFL